MAISFSEFKSGGVGAIIDGAGGSPRSRTIARQVMTRATGGAISAVDNCLRSATQPPEANLAIIQEWIDGLELLSRAYTEAKALLIASPGTLVYTTDSMGHERVSREF